MMLRIPKPKKVKVELTQYEIELIINELESVPHNVYQFLRLNKLIQKLKLAQKVKKWKLMRLNQKK